MEATQVKPSANGVIKIARRGRVKFQLEDDVTFELDVVAVNDEWDAMDWMFRDVENKIAKEKYVDWLKAKHDYFQAVVNDAYAATGADHGAPQMSRGETDAVRKLVEEEVKKLQDFFSPKKVDPSSSSPETSDQLINFSQ